MFIVKKTKISSVFLLLILFAPMCAICQVSPSNPGGFNNTDPRSPAYNQGLSVAPREQSEKWLDSWGAIASDKEGEFGIITEASSKKEAQRFAVSACKQRGGNNCAASFTFVNQCAAVIADPVVGSQKIKAPYEDEAVKMGMDSCKSHGGTSCRVYYSGCSLPVKVD